MDRVLSVVLFAVLCTKSALAVSQSPYEALEAPFAGFDRFMQVQQPAAAAGAASPLLPVTIASQGVGSPLQMPPMPLLSRISSIVPEPGAQNDEDADAAMIKLNQALEAVKEDIMGNNKQINDENKWMEAVQKIQEAYSEKMQRVTDHVRLLRHDQRGLFEKKKQIENLKLQHRLEKKLTEAKEEMSALRATLEKVQVKSHELHTSHSSLQKTIIDIQGQLDKLQGQAPDTPAAPGAGSTGSNDVSGAGEEVLAV